MLRIQRVHQIRIFCPHRNHLLFPRLPYQVLVAQYEILPRIPIDKVLFEPRLPAFELLPLQLTSFTEARAVFHAARLLDIDLLDNFLFAILLQLQVPLISFQFFIVSLIRLLSHSFVFFFLLLGQVLPFFICDFRYLLLR